MREGPRSLKRAAAALALCLLASRVTAQTAPAAAETPKPTIAWAADLPAAQAEAKTSGKLVLLLASSADCSWCQRLDEEVFPDAMVIEAISNFVPVHEETGLEREGDETVMRDSTFMKEHQTPFTPTYYVLDSEGEIVDSFFGFRPAPEIAVRLAQAKASHQDFATAESRLRKTPADLNAACAYACGLAARAKVKDAERVVQEAEGEGKPHAELAQAYNRIADAHYEAYTGCYCELYGDAAKYDDGAPEAAAWFERTLQASTDPALVAYAHCGLSTCLRVQNKPDEAKRHLETILAMDKAPKSLHARAEMLLTFLSLQRNEP